MNESASDPAAVVAALQRAADEARRRGTPAALDEEEILETFRRLAPPGATAHGARAQLERLGTTHVDVDVPVDGGRRLLVPVKRILRKLQAWYLRHVVDQVNVALGMVTAVLEEHQRRLDDALRDDVGELGVDPAPVVTDSAVDLVGDRLTGIPGRVLVAWCGRAGLVARLDADGYDAYGIDPSPTAVAEALREGLDVRSDDPLTHLRRLPPAGLGAVVLAGAVDVMTTGGVATVLDAAHRALAEGARVVLLADPGTGDPVRFELAGVVPRGAAAWCRLLEARGFVDVDAVDAGPGLVLISGHR